MVLLASAMGFLDLKGTDSNTFEVRFSCPLNCVQSVWLDNQSWFSCACSLGNTISSDMPPIPLVLLYWRNVVVGWFFHINQSGLWICSWLCVFSLLIPIWWCSMWACPSYSLGLLVHLIIVSFYAFLLRANCFYLPTAHRSYLLDFSLPLLFVDLLRGVSNAPLVHLSLYFLLCCIFQTNHSWVLPFLLIQMV